jgi:hypothetical protein
MKVLALIWAVAILSGVVAVQYVNASINQLVTKPIAVERTVVTPNLQGGSINAAEALQPARVTLQGSSPQLQAQTGGNGQNYELQPALGYGALNNTVLQ